MSAKDGKSSVDEEQEKLSGSREELSSLARSAMLAVLISDCGGWLTWSLRQRLPVGVIN